MTATLLAVAPATLALDQHPPRRFDFLLDPGGWLLGTGRLIELGGPVVVVQLLVSIVGFAIVLYKLLQFARIGETRIGALERGLGVWLDGNRKQATQLLAASRLPFADDVLAALARLAPDNVEAVREVLLRRARETLQPLHAHLSTIEIIYYIAPLLGLLGTVTGIIASFRALEMSGATNDAAQLAGGIWEALIATGVGLATAIPFAVIHGLFEARLRGIVGRFENLISRIATSFVEHAPGGDARHV